MTFLDVVCAVIVGNAAYVVIGAVIDAFLVWVERPKGPRPGGDATAKEVQMAWDKVMGHYDEWAGDEEPEENGETT